MKKVNKQSAKVISGYLCTKCFKKYSVEAWTNMSCTMKKCHCGEKLIKMIYKHDLSRNKKDVIMLFDVLQEKFRHKTRLLYPRPCDSRVFPPWRD
jgi:hypothetical protein